MSVPPESNYAPLRRLGDLGRDIERRRGPDPYPSPAGPVPSLDELRRPRDEINRLAARHGASTVRMFGSVARGDAGPHSDLDVLVEMGERRGLFEQAALQGDLEDLLGCRVHVVTTGGLRHARNMSVSGSSGKRFTSDRAPGRRPVGAVRVDSRARDLLAQENGMIRLATAWRRRVAHTLAGLFESAGALGPTMVGSGRSMRALRCRARPVAGRRQVA